MQVWQQDENSSAARLPGKERSGGAKALSGWQGAFAAPGKHLAGPSARKALGNITNQQGLRTPGAALAPKKALGDITTATDPLKVAADLGNAARPKPAQSAAAGMPDASIAPECPEHLAGMGWRDLEAARHAQMNAEISARLAAIAAAPSYNPFFQPQGTCSVSVLEGLDQHVRPPSRSASPQKELPGLGEKAAACTLDVYKDDWSLDVFED